MKSTKLFTKYVVYGAKNVQIRRVINYNHVSYMSYGKDVSIST